jgi:hypothetical protein
VIPIHTPRPSHRPAETEEETHLGSILLKRAFASSSLSTLGTFLSFAYAGPRMVRMAVLPIWSVSASGALSSPEATCDEMIEK